MVGGVGVELVAPAGQGMAGHLGQRGSTRATTSDAVGGRAPHLGQRLEDLAVQVEGVGHDQGMGEHQADHVGVGVVAVDADHRNPHPQAASVTGGEGGDGSSVAPGLDAEHHAPGRVGEHRGVDVVALEGALVDGQVLAQPGGVGR